MRNQRPRQHFTSLQSVITLLVVSIAAIALIYTLASSPSVIAQITADVLLFAGFIAIVGLAIYYLMKQ